MGSDDVLARLEAVRGRLASTRPVVEAGAPWSLAERFDHTPEAAWGPPEALAHVSEMLPYWLAEVERIVTAPAGPVPFGRIGTDPVRIATIERDRSLPIGELYDRIDAGFAGWTRRLETLSTEEWTRLGAHPTRGDMSIEAIVDRMIVSHSEEHAEQLEGLLGAAG